MPKVETSPYTTKRQQLQTQPVLLARFLVPGAVGSGVEYPFSRDFAGPAAPLNPTRAPYLYLGQVSGNTQTVDWRTGTTSRGALTLPLLDKGGLITAYCSDPQLGVASAIGTGTVTSIEATAATGGYPDHGTLELVAADGSKERIRYTSRSAESFLGILRAVDGTTAKAWPAGTVLHNGEQIRPGTRVAIYAGYADLAEADMTLLDKFEVLERGLAPDRVTWLIQCSDVQVKANVQVFRAASQRTPLTLGPEHPAKLALRVLLSTGDATNWIYDTLAADNGAGVDQALVDVTAFEALAAAASPGAQFEFAVTGPADAAAWVAQQCLHPLGAVLWMRAGKISVKRLLLAPTSADSVATLSESNLVAWGPWAAGDREIVNMVGVLFDWKRITLPGEGQQETYEYGRRQQFEATKSIGLYGRRPVNGTGQPFTWQGVLVKHNLQDLLDDYAARVFKRVADPAAILPVKTFYTQHHLELGDIVTVSHAQVPNLATGLRGLSSELMQIVDTRPLFGREGGMVLKLSTVKRGPSPSGDVFARTTADLTAPLTLTAPENFGAAQLQDNVILTWKAVPGADHYEIREGETWDGAKVIVANWRGVSFVVGNVLDGAHKYRIRAITGSTQSPESIALLTTAGIDGERNIVINRDEMALGFPGTKTGMAFIAELTPDALTNLAGLWFDTIPTRWFADAALSGRWFRHAGSLVYETISIDKGKTGPAALLLTLLTRATDSGQWFDAQPTKWFSDLSGAWFDAAPSPATMTVDISTSNDNVNFSAFAPSQDGASYDFRYLKLRVTLTPDSQSAWVRIETMRLVIDVPDVIKELKGEAIPAAGKTYSFSALGLTFVNAPFVTIMNNGGVVNKAVLIKNLTTTGFDVELRDKTDALVAGTVDLRIQGF